MKQNKYLEEVWEWKERSNKTLEGLSIKESIRKIKQETSKIIEELGIRYVQSIVHPVTQIEETHAKVGAVG